jgi:hypothetical protein
MSDYQISETSDIEDVPCECIVAVKIKDGGQDCLACGKNAYNSQYDFSHTPAGAKRLAEAKLPVTLMSSEIKPSAVLPPKKMPTRAKKPKAVKTVNRLLEAVRFIQLAQRPKGDAMMTHCCIRYGTITAFDRTIAAGAVIQEEDLMCFPDTALLALALDKCDAEHRIVQSADQLFIESGSFSAYVPLSPADAILTAIPDPMIAPLGESFRTALKTVGVLVKDAGATLLQMAIQLNPYSAIATNGQVLLQGWHGYDFPPLGMLIPKRFADLVNKTKKEIIGFGYSSSTMPGDPTFTIHFKDKSWLRTNLYKEKFPYDITAPLNVEPAHKMPTPAHFFEAAADIANWSENGRVYCFDGRISSHPATKQNIGGARTFAMDGFAENRIYRAADLKLIAKHAVSMDMYTSDARTYFFGESVRGAITHEDIAIPEPLSAATQADVPTRMVESSVQCACQ